MLFHNAICSEENGYTKEEMKLVRENKKNIKRQHYSCYRYCSSCVIVEVTVKLLNVEFNDFDVNEVCAILKATDGIVR
jgi:aspartate-semialdehyde dehydrogenase